MHHSVRKLAEGSLIRIPGAWGIVYDISDGKDDTRSFTVLWSSGRRSHVRVTYHTKPNWAVEVK